jgi:hypothetical protein
MSDGGAIITAPSPVPVSSPARPSEDVGRSMTELEPVFAVAKTQSSTIASQSLARRVVQSITRDLCVGLIYLLK